MDPSEVVPEEFRCKRSDGKQWRCSARSMPDKTVCEKHYIQAKKRAANSALRANQKKMKRREELDNANANTNGEGSHGNEMERVAVAGKKPKDRDRASKNQAADATFNSPASSMRGGHPQLSNEEVDLEMRRSQSVEKEADYTRRKSKHSKTRLPTESGGNNGNSGEQEIASCHQCQKTDRRKLVACLKCKRKSYCVSCISKWYPSHTREDIEKACPVCRRICRCKSCLHDGRQMKLQQFNNAEKSRHLHYLLSMVLPTLRQIHTEQLYETNIESKIKGCSIKAIDVPRAKLHEDERLSCNRCHAIILDYHRNCPECSYDLCLRCCRIICEGQLPGWKVKSDGNISCPSKESGGCGISRLILKRVYKANWIARIEKDAEELTSNCKISDSLKPSSLCSSCYKLAMSGKNGYSEKKLRVAAHRKYNSDNVLYCPVAQNYKEEGLEHFQKHWLRGHPVIVRNVLEGLMGLSWEPAVMWKAVQNSPNEMFDEDGRIVKAIECRNWRDIVISIRKFFKGYLEGKLHKNGWPEMLKLKDWPPSNFFEEHLPRHRSDFINDLPFPEYTHPEWGIFNLASKLPEWQPRAHLGPKAYIAYGNYEELGAGDSVTKLHYHAHDVVNVLVHTAEAKSGETYGDSDAVDNLYREKERGKNIYTERTRFEVPCSQNFSHLKGNSSNEEDDSDDEQNWGLDETSYDGASQSRLDERANSQKKNSVATHGGARWDIFRREDVPKLTEYLHKNFNIDSAASSFHDQVIFLDEQHKRKLKEEYQVEPWTFEQNLGEAVMVPAGCPHQVRNLKSCIKLSVDFVSAESLQECVRVQDELHLLSEDHMVKQNSIEVKKMALYAANSAIKEIQKLTLESNDGNSNTTENANLTALVMENLIQMKKQKKEPVIQSIERMNRTEKCY